MSCRANLLPFPPGLGQAEQGHPHNPHAARVVSSGSQVPASYPSHTPRGMVLKAHSYTSLLLKCLGPFPQANGLPPCQVCRTALLTLPPGCTWHVERRTWHVARCGHQLPILESLLPGMLFLLPPIFEALPRAPPNTHRTHYSFHDGARPSCLLASLSFRGTLTQQGLELDNR